MQQTKDMLNDVLVKMFNQILFNEETVLQQELGNKISVRNVHILDAIFKAVQDNNASISNVAKSLNITTGTLTVAINKLVKQGYVTKKQSSSDRRFYYVALTKEGKKIVDLHAQYHKNLINFIVSNLSIKEEADLIDLLSKLKYYFS